jgi:hypothetical protein
MHEFKLNKLLFPSIIIFVLATFAFSIIVIKNFSSPLTGWAGIGPFVGANHDYLDIQEYTGFYFAKNLSFKPFPQLKLVKNQVFYPYGTNSVFQPWSIEKDLIYALIYSHFKTGPWLQFYYLVTVLITAIGSFLLLYRDYGFARAIGVGFIVSFGNFYAINKYPQHLQYAVVHWIILSVITDFLIVKRVTLRHHVSLRLILVRISLLFLSFGHDLGYIAGLGLMSFTVSILFIAVLSAYRYFRGEFKLIESCKREIQGYQQDLLTYPRTCLAFIAVSGIAAYLYLPLALQIGREAKTFDFTGIPIRSHWTNPLRLLIPFLPILNPERGFHKILKDSPESLGAGSPGWFLLILGILGLWQSRRNILMFFPLLIIFFLCLAYHPVLFPTLKIFPWFAFNRVGGRSTIIYPVILCFFALHININWLDSQKKRVLVALLVVLAVIEVSVAYSFRQEYQPALLDKSFYTYMDYVKKQPGEAVLDWPFCVTGSGFGKVLCPYYVNNSGIFALRRFHEKKVMGQYFGRLHPSQGKPYLDAGWDKLFFPDKTGTRQKRCFNEAEWSFFTEFFKLNDFAGINLYLERLPQECLTEFYKRFGNPVVETIVPGAGRVQFIPKSPELRKEVNPELGVSLEFR